MGTYVNIYLANNLGALDVLAKPSSTFTNIKKFDKLCGALDKLYKSTQENPLDQEKTYILLTRYLYLYNVLRNSQNDKLFVEVRFGHECRKVQAQLEQIRKSLTERYNALSQEKPKNDQVFIPKLDDKIEIKSTIFKSDFVSCLELYSALKLNSNMLLVDARPDCDFQKSKLNIPNILVINVPEDCIASGLSANMLGKKLNEQTQNVWDKRDCFDVLVLFDWNTTKDNFNYTKLQKLYLSLVDWDLNRNYKEKPVILQGGYLEILQTYPTLCINPQVYLSYKNTELDELLDIDNIEYPKEIDNTIQIFFPTTDENENKENKINSEINNNERLIQELVNAKKKLKSCIISYRRVIASKRRLGESPECDAIDLKAKQQEFDNKSKEYTSEIRNLQECIRNIKNQLHCDISGSDDEVILDSSKKPIETPIKPVEPDIIDITKDDNINDKVDKEIELDLANIPSIPVIVPDAKPIVDRATKPRKEIAFRRIKSLNHHQTGLINIRNTCYINTTLQCLRNINHIADLFCGNKYLRLRIRKPAAIIHETAEVIDLLWSEKNHFAPINFYKKVCTLNPIYAIGNHEDCMEFFTFLLNHLTEDCQIELNQTDVLTPKQQAWRDAFQGKISVMQELFFHQIRIVSTCATCNKSSTRFEMENTFMLPVPSHKFSLEKIMRDYMSDYVIDDCFCATCKKPMINSKSLCYEPKILVIHLKRYTTEGVKINSKVEFPNSFNFGSSVYHLRAVALHAGTLNAGHYSAVLVHKDLCYEFSDNRIRSTKINTEIISINAYAFFYSS